MIVERGEMEGRDSEMGGRYPWTVLHVDEMELQATPQGHPGITGVNRVTAGTDHIGAIIIKLDPGAEGHYHVHDNHESVIYFLEGFAATLMGYSAEPVFTRSGDFLVIPPGVPHKPLCLGPQRMVALTIRSDPQPLEDLQRLYELDKIAAPRIRELRSGFFDGTLPVDWQRANGDYQGGEPYRLPQSD